MKQFINAIVITIILFSCSVNKQTEEHPKEHGQSELKDNTVEIQKQSEPDTLKGSLKAKAFRNINGTDVTILYSSPAVRGRIIWGGLVAYETVWVTGAHMATSIEFDRTIRFGEKEIPAGKYGFFTIPGTEAWTIILNKNWEQHLADEYDQKDDVIRFQIVPEKSETNQERLMYEVDQTGEGKFSILISWEKIRINIPFELAE